MSKAQIDVIFIARMAHEANRTYCQSIGDDSQLPWDEAPQWQRDSCIAGVNFHIENPNATESASHECWRLCKENEGWVYGEVKDPEKKTHPCMVPYDDLPQEQQVKDGIFKSIVDVFRRFLPASMRSETIEPLASALPYWTHKKPTAPGFRWCYAPDSPTIETERHTYVRLALYQIWVEKEGDRLDLWCRAIAYAVVGGDDSPYCQGFREGAELRIIEEVGLGGWTRVTDMPTDFYWWSEDVFIPRKFDGYGVATSHLPLPPPVPVDVLANPCASGKCGVTKPEDVEVVSEAKQ